MTLPSLEFFHCERCRIRTRDPCLSSLDFYQNLVLTLIRPLQFIFNFVSSSIISPDKISKRSYCLLGWTVEMFLIGQNRSTNQRSRMILEVQIQNFGVRQSFHFRKIPGGLNITIFW